MPTIKLKCPLHNSYRVQQIGGMFDVPLEKKLETTIEYEMPPLDDPNWKIGVIVGLSGSGKSSIAKNVFGNALYQPKDWPKDKAVIDGFGEYSAKEITAVLTLVGFSSPPNWIKPYSVLSNGEQFRCDLARALLRGEGRGTRGELVGKRLEVRGECISSPLTPHPSPLTPHPSPLTPHPSPLTPHPSPLATVVFDEFTSVVDRNVAKIASAAIAKAIKTGKLNCRFVAVTCHYDILDWLEPDWVLDTAAGKCSKVLLRRPKIELQIAKVHHSDWKYFSKYHYLNTARLPTSSQCYAAFWNGNPAAFCAIINNFSKYKGYRRVSRIVTLPDYQGIGIGKTLLNFCADKYKKDGFRVTIGTIHPGMVQSLVKDPKWHLRETKENYDRGRKNTVILGRRIAFFEYW